MTTEITYSSAQALLLCPRKYMHAYEHKLKPVSSTRALDFGREVHRALQGVEPARDYVAQAICARWRAPDLVATEQQFRRRVFGPRGAVHRGSVDGITDDGMLYEIKTTSQTVDECCAEIRNGLQIPSYQLAFALPCVVDVLKKPVVRRRDGEDDMAYAARAGDAYTAEPARFFRRVVVDYQSALVDEARDVLIWCVRRIVVHRRKGSWPRQYGAQCRGPYGGPCEYRGLCWYGDADQYRRAEHEHEELDGGSDAC
jgi:hypothetical protein